MILQYAVQEKGGNRSVENGGEKEWKWNVMEKEIPLVVITIRFGMKYKSSSLFILQSDAKKNGNLVGISAI